MKFIFLIALIFCNNYLNAGIFNQALRALVGTGAPESNTEKMLAQWFKAVEDDNIDQLRALHGKVDINAQDKNGNTALMLAAQGGQESIVQFLLNLQGINVNTQKSAGFNALLISVYWGYENIVNLLCQIPSINVNAQDENGYTALIWASEYNHGNILKQLLSVPGIDINVQDSHGDTALTIAVAEQHENIAQLLLREPAININLQNKVGFSALSIAAYWGFDNFIKLLLKTPASTFTHAAINVNAKDDEGNTPLILAATTGHENSVKLLLDDPRTNINAQNDNEATALLKAKENNYISIENLIKNKIAQLTENAFEAIKKHDLGSLKLSIAQLGIAAIVGSNLSSASSIENEETDLVQAKANRDGHTILDKAFGAANTEIIFYLLAQADDPLELLSRFPFEFIDPNSKLFEYFVDLAYATPAKPHKLTSRKRKRFTLTKSLVPILSVEASQVTAESPGFNSKSCAHCSTVLTHTSPRHKAGSPFGQKLQPQARVCANCSKPDCTERCSLCKAVYYCSSECQKTDWKNHKNSCKN